MILNFFNRKIVQKVDIDLDYRFLKMTLILLRELKIQRNTTNIAYLRTFFRYFAV
jgi:hypothetical protein